MDDRESFESAGHPLGGRVVSKAGWTEILSACHCWRQTTSRVGSAGIERMQEQTAQALRVQEQGRMKLVVTVQ